MKHLKKLAAFIFCSIVFWMASTCSAHASASPILHLKFNNNYKDSASGIAMTYYGNTKFVTGKSGTAIYLDGDGDYMKLGTGYNLTSDFTFSTWLKSESQDRSDAALLAKYETDHYGPYDFYLSYNRPAFWASDGQGDEFVFISDTTLQSSKWYLLTYVYKKSQQKLTIYINGKYDTSFECPNLTTNGDSVTVGRQALMFSPYSHLEYKGYLDDLRLYERAFSASEISQLYNSYPKQYTVTFVNSDGTVLKRQTVSFGKSATPPKNPTKPKNARYSYKFKKWNKSCQNITGNVTITAQYSKTINKYKITLQSNNGRNTKYTKTVKYGSKYGNLPKPQRTGYKFQGWHTKKTGGSKITKNTICKGKRTVYAHWTRIRK